MTHTFPYLKAFVRAVKRRLPHVPTLTGGVHATLGLEESIRVEGLDTVCQGEGESVIVDVLRRIEDGKSLSDVLGLYVKEGGEIGLPGANVGKYTVVSKALLINGFG